MTEPVKRYAYAGDAGMVQMVKGNYVHFPDHEAAILAEREHQLTIQREWGEICRADERTRIAVDHDAAILAAREAGALAERERIEEIIRGCAEHPQSATLFVAGVREGERQARDAVLGEVERALDGVRGQFLGDDGLLHETPGGPYKSGRDIRAAIAALRRPEPGRCICDGGAYEVKAHPFIVNDACAIHGRPEPAGGEG